MSYVAIISQVQFSNSHRFNFLTPLSIEFLIIHPYQYKFLWIWMDTSSVFHRTPLMIVNIGSANSSLPSGNYLRLILTHISDHMASGAHNERTHWGLVTPYSASSIVQPDHVKTALYIWTGQIIKNKSGVKRLNTLGHLDQYMAQHGHIEKQSYCETV